MINVYILHVTKALTVIQVVHILDFFDCITFIELKLVNNMDLNQRLP